ncbi:MAG: endonuclease domain-containing protein [Gammaproteobacteria bacterium]|nr:endonuclease domain-containing protein [Gammaproteobacteria bacterium]
METRAKHLRKSQTPVEQRLWLALKEHQFCQYKFRRQVILGPYIVDFVCLKKRLGIELDGYQHLNNHSYDQIRTEYLESLGFSVLRFWNHQVLENWPGVLHKIYLVLQSL